MGEAVTAQLHAVALLSARVQKEDAGYSLRSSVAYAPKEAEDRLCWDLFQRGCCPRRQQCRWYHPESSDTGKIKISIKQVQGAMSQATSSRCQARLLKSALFPSVIFSNWMHCCEHRVRWYLQSVEQQSVLHHKM